MSTEFSTEFSTKRSTIPGAEELLDRYFPMLDHGFIALKDYMGSDDAIDEAARTSYGGGTRHVSDRRSLLRRLRRKRHTSPFEMVELKFHVGLPIFVARQWVRHRTANINEYSARYSVMPMLFYVPEREVVGVQSINNKQGRGRPLTEEEFERYLAEVERSHTQSRISYEEQVSLGVARETARGVLPVSVYTQWFWKCDLHNLLHFLSLRCAPDAQLEVRKFAMIMAGMVKKIAPLSFEAWIDYNFASQTMSRVEMEILRSLLKVSPRGTVSSSPSVFSGGGINEDGMLQMGLSKTEITEFREKLQPSELPSFDLDMTQTKDGEFFRKRWSDAVPKIDRVL